MDLATYFRSVMALSHGIVVTLDTSGHVIHGNALLEQVTGYRLTDLVGEHWFTRLLPEADRQSALEQFRHCIAQGHICEIDGRIQRRDGQRAHIQWRLKPLSGTGEDRPGVLMVGQDITDHHRSREHLIAACADLQERNRELACLYGVARVVDHIERPLDDILEDIIALIPPALQCPDHASVGLTVDGRRISTPGHDPANVRLSQEIVVGDTTRGRLSVATAPSAAPQVRQRREESELIAVVARQVGLIIAKKEGRDTERDLKVQLRHSDRLAKIGQLAAGVAHELNEPLANILGFAQLAAKADGLPPQVSQDLAHIIKSSLHAREVIKKLMFFSRQVPPQKTRTDLNHVIEDALLLSASSAVRQGVAVDCVLTPHLPPITADPQQLKQVVINLAANAIQAMPDGGTLRILTHTEQQHVIMRIEDNGRGMNNDTLAQIFTPFFTTKEVDEGSGLGLSVVHGIVQAHGGTIDVHSTVGSGTCVTVSFPLTEPPP